MLSSQPLLRYDWVLARTLNSYQIPVKLNLQMEITSTQKHIHSRYAFNYYFNAELFPFNVVVFLIAAQVENSMRVQALSSSVLYCRTHIVKCLYMEDFLLGWYLTLDFKVLLFLFEFGLTLSQLFTQSFPL